MDESGWCTVESDPGVFTELLEKIGVRGVQVEELYSLDKSLCEELKPVYGLIFLFNYRPEERQISSSRPGVVEHAPDVFFAKQVIHNACATQAILSIIFNAPEIDPGPELRSFKEFTADFDPMAKGITLSNSETIRAAHNAFAPQQQFYIEEKEMAKEEDVYHFVAFVPIHGRVYELDGLQEGPRRVGEVAEGQDWLEVVTPIIQTRIEEYSGIEIRFNLMAVVQEIKPKLQKQLAVLEEDLSKFSEKENSVEFRKLSERSQVVRAKIIEEEEKRAVWAKENTRRKHSFVPFIMNLLKLMAKRQQLEPVVKKARDRKKEAAEKESAKKDSSGRLEQ